MVTSDKYLEFKSSWGRYVDNHDGTYYMARPRIKLSGDYVPSSQGSSLMKFMINNIVIDRRYDEGGRYLDTDANPSTPYTPQYPGSPATKKYVDDNIPTNVSDLTNDSNFQTATQVSQAISTAVSSAYKYKGSVASYSNLPASGNTEGDVWNVTDTGMNYAWTGSAWDALGATVDLSNYIAKNNTTAFTPSGDYNPSTKKYVDDTVASAKSSGATAPSNPTEGMLWYDTINHVLKIYNGTDWETVDTDSDTTYTAGNGINISAQNEISVDTSVIATKQYVDDSVADVIPSGSTAPQNPQEGDLWYDTVNHVLKIYNGTSWETVDTDTDTTYTAGNGINIDANNEISVDTTIIPTQADLVGKQDILTAGDNIQISAQNVISATDTTYTAGDGIAILNGNDYSAMQGPAPTGYHVPLQSEWQGLKTIMDGLSLTTGSDWKINLHLPFAGRRIVNASTNNQGVYAYYWSSSPYGSAYPYNASGLLISSSISTNSSGNRSGGHSVRCFNNSFISPTSSWTVITGTLGGAGIFRNQTEGLISITSNGTTGYTIQDKNLGATTVYNDGDTLSEANCGKYYQWGNNYGFLRTGDITTSSTQVNASAYGPGNYYSSSTFITGSTDRSSVHNDNLWGGVTGVVTLANAITSTQLSDEAFSSSWDGDTTHAPSKNAIYDVLGDVETLLANL